MTKTARLVTIDQDPKSNVVFADAQVFGDCPICSPEGETITGVGFSYDGGKFSAMWDLVQKLNEREIELE